jgi:putative DNA primase/helicase
MTTTNDQYEAETTENQGLWAPNSGASGPQTVLARSRTAIKEKLKLRRISDVAIAAALASGPLSGAVKAEGEFWCYTGSRWEAIPKHELSQLVQDLDGKRYRAADDTPAVILINEPRIEGVLKVLGDRAPLAQPDFFNTRPPGINCESGFIVFDMTGRSRLEPHAPEHRQQHVLRGNWTPGTGNGQRVRDCLMRNFLGDEDAQQKLDLLAEAAGVAALGLGGSKDAKAIIFVGEAADNGKSTVLDLIRAGLPENAGTALPPSKFGDDHHAVLLRGKLLNAVAELGTAGVIAGDAFKKMITGDEFAARGLYKDTFTYRPRAQHIFACNSMPAFQGGVDRGVLRRLLILQFNRVIPREERDGKVDRLPIEHADDFLAWIVDGASRYIQQGGFTVPTSSEAALKDWAEHADPVLGWIAERVAPVCPVDAKCSSAAAYTDFELYCQAELRMRDRDIPRLRTFVDRCKAALKATSNIRHGHSGSFRGFTGMWLREQTGMIKTLSDTGEDCRRRGA